MKMIPYFHREMLRTLAGIKTGVVTWAPPDAIVNKLRPAPQALGIAPAGA
jgi:hypothetical protein